MILRVSSPMYIRVPTYALFTLANRRLEIQYPEGT
jgi:hypothetical protein